MVKTKNILISLEQRHAENIFSGAKTVEFRRRQMHIEIGTTVWIYSTLPVGAIIGRACVSELHRLAPTTLWKKFSSVSGLSHAEFSSYYQGVAKGFAVTLEAPIRLEKPIFLGEIRKTTPTFHPPQFFTRLLDNGSLIKRFERQK